MKTSTEKSRKKAKPSKGDQGPSNAQEATPTIPWEDIFKRHASILEGHQRLLQLVQKHTVTDSEDWTMVTSMIKRMENMHEQFQESSRIFGEKQKSGQETKLNGTATSSGKEEKAATEPDNPYFVIDTKPTPVNLPPLGNGPHKRTLDEPSHAESTGPPASKKAKVKPSEPEAQPPKVEFEDISAEVDARLKEKENKRKNKDKKKRKRDSEGNATETLEQTNAEEAEAQPPKQKRSKKSKAGDGEDKKGKEVKPETNKGEDKATQEEEEGQKQDAPKRDIKKAKKRTGQPKEAKAAENADPKPQQEATDPTEQKKKKKDAAEEQADKEKPKKTKLKRVLESLNPARDADSELPIRNANSNGDEQAEGVAEVPNKRRKKNKDKAVVGQ